ncbi:hypothetical protein FPZ54_01730 [Sphingomonas suaedae]|uniref:Helix-turn-helix domain-containing protein n=1 Tax=Sphingomonas suaedae TaxID=2599297 RepID=A0A518RBQ0_9SPHN|nr:hypothetical protein [Sphingomonas suaedae]QDX24873.1 hypothetical protein FPZ54_01730 [Sphingomonas suaedae]
MATRLEAMRDNCRVVTRVVGEELYAAAIDLAERLPEDVQRARLICLPIVMSITRDMIDREMRSLATQRGPSINSIATSLDLPFETVRRNILRLHAANWVEIGEAGGVTLPNPVPASLATWCVELGGRLRRIAERIEALGATDPRPIGDGSCDNSCILGALDLCLAMAGTKKHFGLRFTELLVVNFVCTASVVHLNAGGAGTNPYAEPDTVPPDAERAFIPLDELAKTIGVSRSTIYRIVSNAERSNLFERRGYAVRPAASLLGSPTYVQALQLVAGRTATLFSRIERHRCGLGCTALDQVLGRPRPWRQTSTLLPRPEIG